jgi:hypothetical protein
MRGYHECGNGDAILLHAPQDFEAVDSGQAQIEKDEIEGMLLDELERIFPIVTGGDVMSFIPQQPAHGIANLGLVIDD